MDKETEELLVKYSVRLTQVEDKLKGLEKAIGSLNAILRELQKEI